MNHTKAWWRPAGYAVVGLGIGLLLATFLAALAVIGEIRSTQLEGTPTGKKLIASANRILDCTEPGDGKDTPAGECYQRSQRQTRDILTSAQRIILLSAACSVDLDPADDVNQRIQQVTACVVDRLSDSPVRP